MNESLKRRLKAIEEAVGQKNKRKLFFWGHIPDGIDVGDADVFVFRWENDNGLDILGPTEEPD